ncbi:uncharacterized protein KY384_000626 [Bacidia gigantensis]|uniref:uncharacterized protein n=1 Tax=Bacidia gigantensis TaxID=2732470 RepID=UPI001D037CF5|nr:uncharacterized protein KY384_000626 [Bacidia gigantensis]KAG8525866.1 hypothetical protein KY384_000626 [Bacidia gigantensis]
MSLRRSARAPTTQPAPNARRNTNSSTSSVSSGQPDRKPRSQPKSGSPLSSAAARSPSPETPRALEDALPRRTRSTQDDTRGEGAVKVKRNGEDNEEEEEEEEEDEEEETRCICGHQEYPGLPVIDAENSRRRSQVDSDPTSEDTTGWFIQCDECQVWQHGGCVGILDETQSPEKYFCERCHRDLHEIGQDLNGRNYSRYLPANGSNSNSASPELRSKDHPKRTRETKPTRTELENLAKGRRATMNSRDSAYDEAEHLRRAIEESKKDSLAKTNGTRKGKRGRSESEGLEDSTKRRRTASGSTSSQSKQRLPGDISDDEAEKLEALKSIRGATARNHRSKEVRGKEAGRERERTEGSKEKHSNQKRKIDDYFLKSPSAKWQGISRSGSVQITQKRWPPPARKSRLGRNQYSKDREPPKQTTHSPPSNNSQDRDISNGSNGAHGNGAAESNGLGKPSRPRHMNPNRTTMNDMKRRVAGILEYISHIQVQMASLDAARPKLNLPNNHPPGTSGQRRAGARGKGEAVVGANELKDIVESLDQGDIMDGDAYEKLNALGMMEVLTKQLMKWQQQFGKYGEK